MHACMQVVEVLGDALSLPETPVPLKVARLLLASDILHNSSAPVRNASRYRSLLEAALPDIFESLQVWAPPSLPFQPYHPSTSEGLLRAAAALRQHFVRVLRHKTRQRPELNLP